MLFNILALISFFICLLLLRTFVEVFPSLMACLVRWKESVNLDASVMLSRDRDIMAIAMIMPFCLTAARFSMYTPSWTGQFGADGRLGITIGIVTINNNRNLDRILILSKIVTSITNRSLYCGIELLHRAGSINDNCHFDVSQLIDRLYLLSDILSLPF